VGESTALFSVSLVVTTRGRYEPLAARLPVWAAAGFDEVIVVDGSSDSGTRAKTSSLCERNGVVYVPGPVRLRDTRSLSRNLGARNAHGTWILFQDDDDDAVVSIDKNALRAATIGKDWLAGPRGEIIVWHRKEAFLAFGGYPEDMVAAEDWIMSNRARAHGKGGLEPTWYEGERRFPPSRQDPIGRSRNAFWYGYTLLLFLLRCPNSTDVIVGDSARLLLQVGQAFRQLRAFVYVGMGLFGRALSPVHCLKVRVQSGKDAIRQEPFADWQGIRP
jgi:hypothetical protein